jgi:hypothetical protein
MMNLFRSEEHVRNWDRFDSSAEEGILALSDLVGVFSGSLFRRRLDSDFVSRSPEYMAELMGVMGELAKARPFWTPPGA